MTRWSDRASQFIGKLPFTIDTVLTMLERDSGAKTLNPPLLKLKEEAEQLILEHKRNLKKRNR